MQQRSSINLFNKRNELLLKAHVTDLDSADTENLNRELKSVRDSTALFDYGLVQVSYRFYFS